MRRRGDAARMRWSPLLALTILATTTAPRSEDTLGGYPVCEASAALIVPCPERPESDCLLVADNEQSEALFLYDLSETRVRVASRREVDIAESKPRAEVSDIEALARLASGEILVYGSHGRNRKCRKKAKRRRLLGLELEPGGAVPGRVGPLRVRVSANLADTFGAERTGLLAEVAEAVRAAERDADSGRCEAAFEIEGAAVAPGLGPDAKPSVWVGLRSPLVRGHAVLARHDPSRAELRFDAVRLVDLDAQGIRGLSIADGYVWGLSASPGEGGKRPHRVWRFRLEALEDGDRPIDVEEIAEVPPGSEGLAVGRDAIVVVVDGALGEASCRQVSSYVVLRRPARGSGTAGD